MKVFYDLNADQLFVGDGLFYGWYNTTMLTSLQPDIVHCFTLEYFAKHMIYIGEL